MSCLAMARSGRPSAPYQLFDEVLMKGLGYRYRYGTALFFVVGIVTVALGLVVGVIIVVQVLAQVQLIAGIAVFPSSSLLCPGKCRRSPARIQPILPGPD